MNCVYNYNKNAFSIVVRCAAQLEMASLIHICFFVFCIFLRRMCVCAAFTIRLYGSSRLVQRKIKRIFVGRLLFLSHTISFGWNLVNGKFAFFPFILPFCEWYLYLVAFPTILYANNECAYNLNARMYSEHLFSRICRCQLYWRLFFVFVNLDRGSHFMCHSSQLLSCYFVWLSLVRARYIRGYVESDNIRYKMFII